MDGLADLEQRITAERKPGVFVACAVCGGRGHYPTAEAEHSWVPPTSCARCDGSGEEPAGAVRDALARC